MSLRAQISEDMKAAMRAKETSRLSAIRLLLAAIKQREVDERKELDDIEIVHLQNGVHLDLIDGFGVNCIDENTQRFFRTLLLHFAPRQSLEKDLYPAVRQRHFAHDRADDAGIENMLIAPFALLRLPCRADDHKRIVLDRVGGRSDIGFITQKQRRNHKRV